MLCLSDSKSISSQLYRSLLPTHALAHRRCALTSFLSSDYCVVVPPGGRGGGDLPEGLGGPAGKPLCWGTMAARGGARGHDISGTQDDACGAYGERRPGSGEGHRHPVWGHRGERER